MAYHAKTRTIARQEARTLGARLCTQAVAHNLSVQDIAEATGASRATVYNWFKGGGVTPAYQRTVTNLVICLESKQPTISDTLKNNA